MSRPVLAVPVPMHAKARPVGKAGTQWQRRARPQVLAVLAATSQGRNLGSVGGCGRIPAACGLQACN